MTVLEQVAQPLWDTGYKVKWWLCRCACGTVKQVRGSTLKAGSTQSCGCETIPAVKKANTKHGLSQSREYGIWAHVLQRCRNPNAPMYSAYGGKGVTVDDRWLSFPAFIEDMGRCPDGYSLDRIDNAKGYVPGNCRWADIFTQNRNRSSSVWIEWKGQRLTVSEWARALGATRATIRNRWNKHQSLDPIKPSYYPQTRQPSS